MYRVMCDREGCMQPAIGRITLFKDVFYPEEKSLDLCRRHMEPDAGELFDFRMRLVRD